MQGLEYGDIVAPLGEIGGAGKPGRAGTYDGNLMSVGRNSRGTGLRGNGLSGLGSCGGMVGDEPFELSYRHRLSLDAEHAATLALGLLGAYPSAHGGKGRVLRYYPGGTLDIALSEPCDEVRNLQPHRTGRDAAGILAVEASRRLEQGLLHVVAVAYLVEIMCADGRILLAYRHPGNSVRHYASLPILHL